jgi:deoxyribodipyrimidine photolyase-related protein
MYLVSGQKDRTANQLSHHRNIPKGFWDGTTGIEPIDETIKKVLESGYCHHIERLMVLGNFLLLCDTDPNKVYHWFMAYFVDAFDWVMVPNVYDMSQYANLGVITTKPYMSGSNYILKMSDYKKGDWVDLWDGLFWRFMKKHFNLLKKNPRLNMLFAYFKKNQKGLDEKILKAEHWLKKG